MPPSGDDGEGPHLFPRVPACPRFNGAAVRRRRRGGGRLGGGVAVELAASTVPPSGDDGEGVRRIAEECGIAKLQRCRRQETTESRTHRGFTDVEGLLQRCRRQETTESAPVDADRVGRAELASTVPPSGDDGEFNCLEEQVGQDRLASTVPPSG